VMQKMDKTRQFMPIKKAPKHNWIAFFNPYLVSIKIPTNDNN
jgi:hypothetical protein